MPRLADPLRSFWGAFVAIAAVVVLAAVAIIIAPWVQLAIAAYNAGPTTNSAIEVSQVALSSALLTITVLYLIATAIVAWASTWGARHAGMSARAALGAVDEMRAQRAATTRPYVILVGAERRTADVPAGSEFTLKVRNVGVGPALDLCGTVRHDLEPSVMQPYIHCALPALAPDEGAPLYIGFGSGWAVDGGPKVPEGSYVVRGKARIVYRDIEDGWWLTEGAVEITPPSMSARGWDGVVPPIVLRTDTHTVAKVAEGTKP